MKASDYVTALSIVTVIGIGTQYQATLNPMTTEPAAWGYLRVFTHSSVYYSGTVVVVVGLAHLLEAARNDSDASYHTQTVAAIVLMISFLADRFFDGVIHAFALTDATKQTSNEEKWGFYVLQTIPLAATAGLLLYIWGFRANVARHTSTSSSDAQFPKIGAGYHDSRASIPLLRSTTYHP